MIIGVPREIKNNENRVGLTPEGVKKLIEQNHKVYIEKDAGIGSGFSNEEYIRAGGQILYSLKDIYEKSNFIIKVKEPQEIELSFIRENQVIFTYFHLASNEKLTRKLIEKKCICIAYETIEKENRFLPLLFPMSEVAGKSSVILGGYFLSKVNKGKGLLLGGTVGTRSGKIVIIGAGTVGQNALKFAYGLGANVIILDIDIEKLKYLEDIYQNQIETLYSNRENILKVISEGDLIIGTVLIPGDRAPKLILKEDLKLIPKGSLLMDISIDQGGCFETSMATTHENPIYEVDGINHYCVTNIPGAFSETSTKALTNVTYKYLEVLVNNPLEKAIKKYPELVGGINLYKGKCTNKVISKLYNLEFHKLF
ncbi:MAG: alanine dehydrogenase [Cetobacterium sp.]|nr:alanine dehydrogenase [Cetobacterium sp.]